MNTLTFSSHYAQAHIDTQWAVQRVSDKSWTSFTFICIMMTADLRTRTNLLHTAV